MIKDKKMDKARFECKVIIEGIMQDFDKLIYKSNWEEDFQKQAAYQLFWHLKDAYQDQVELLEIEIRKLNDNFNIQINK